MRNPTASGSANTATPAEPRSNGTLFSPAPIYPEYEEAKLARSLTFWRTIMGETDPTVRRILADRTPERAAAELVRGCRLADVNVRKN